MSCSVSGQFEKYVIAQPNAIAIRFETQELTYSQLNSYSNFIAYLLTSQGVKDSSVIAIYGKRSIEMISAMIAVLKLKCIYMPIDIDFPIEYRRKILSNANVKYLLFFKTTNDFEKDISVLSMELNYETFNQKIRYKNPCLAIQSSDPAYVMHTSGSTGVPKGVVIPQRALLTLLTNTNYIDIGSSDTILFHSNSSFDAAIFEVWSALLNGAHIIISPYLAGDLAAIFKICKDKKVTILLLTTGLFHIFSNMHLGELYNLRYLVVGGDVMHAGAALRAIKKSSGFKIINGYGPAENTVFTTCFVIRNESDIKKNIPIGVPISGTQVKLLDEQFNPVTAGEVGEIFISGKGLSLGYINNPTLTSEKFISLPQIGENNIFYRTGDLAKMLPCGNFEFCGRKDNQTKIRGFIVEIAEVENEIALIDFVEDVCVFFIKNQTLAAYVKVNKFHHTNVSADKLEIISILNKKLPSHYIPSYIEISSSISITRNGKVDRNKLKKQLEGKLNNLIYPANNEGVINGY